jgi:hypothetical protein
MFKIGDVVRVTKRGLVDMPNYRRKHLSTATLTVTEVESNGVWADPWLDGVYAFFYAEHLEHATPEFSLDDELEI